MRKCIVTFADDAGYYRQGVERMKESLKAVGFDGDILAFESVDDFKQSAQGHLCPPHSIVPYAFKSWALMEARNRGYDLILWMDAPVIAVKSLDSIFEHIEKEGYVFFDNIGFSIADYTSDICLAHYGMSRRKAANRKMIMSCCFGLNLKDREAMDFLYALHFPSILNWPVLKGDWNNDNLQVSTDPECKGHRHDQSIASIIIANNDLNILTGHETYFTYYEHPEMMPVAESVCLVSKGILLP